MKPSRQPARKHFGGSLAGKLVVTGGMGGMGGAQPLAATMNGAALLCIEADAKRIERRIESRYCDRMTRDLDDALGMLREAMAAKRALSVGLAGNCAEVLPDLVRRGIVPDLLTDQTSAHDPLNGYIPAGYRLKTQPSCGKPIPSSTSIARSIPSPRTSAPCSNSNTAAPSLSITATTSAAWPPIAV